MATMANHIVHFEIHVDDLERAKTFYREVLGWEFAFMEEMNYTLVYPGGEIHEGPATIGINGGVVLREKGAPIDDKAAPSGFVCTVGVEDLDATLARVTLNEGRIETLVQTIPGVGRLAYIRDSELNLVGLLQPDS
jgi:predicted enzyme related to lactoylglutathione lyase